MTEEEQGIHNQEHDMRVDAARAAQLVANLSGVQAKVQAAAVGKPSVGGR